MFILKIVTAQRSAYTPMVNAVNNNSIVQDRISSLLLRNPTQNNIVNQQQHLLNQLTNYSLMQPQQDLSNPFNRNVSFMKCLNNFVYSKIRMVLCTAFLKL